MACQQHTGFLWVQTAMGAGFSVMGSGMLIVSLVPRFGLDQTLKLPPIASTRSPMLISPRPWYPTPSTTNPTPSSTTVRARPSELPAQLHGDRLGLTVLERVLQGFLHDSEDAQGQIGREIRRNAFVGEGDAGTVVREFADQSLESGHQPDHPQCRGVQLVREIPDARRNVVSVLHGFAGDDSGGALHHSGELMEIEFQDGQTAG